MATCGVPIYVGPVFVFLGLFALAFGAIAWDIQLPTPFSRAFNAVVDTAAAAPDAPRRWVWRLLGPLNGTVFVLAGAFLVWGAFACRSVNLGIPNISGPFEAGPLSRRVFDWTSGGLTPPFVLCG